MKVFRCGGKAKSHMEPLATNKSKGGSMDGSHLLEMGLPHSASYLSIYWRDSDVSRSSVCSQSIPFRWGSLGNQRGTSFSAGALVRCLQVRSPVAMFTPTSVAFSLSSSLCHSCFLYFSLFVNSACSNL